MSSQAAIPSSPGNQPTRQPCARLRRAAPPPSLPLSIDGLNVTSILGNVFKESSITSVTMPSSVRHIGSSSFRGCSQLEKVEFSSNLSTIASGAFSDCPKLKDVVLPESVESVGESAFAKDASLVSVTFMNPQCVIDDRKNTVSNSYNNDTNSYTFSGTIVGYTDSTAQRFADKFSYQFKSLGEQKAAAAMTAVTYTADSATETAEVTNAPKTTSTTQPAATSAAKSAVQGKPVFHISETKVYESDLLDGAPQRVTLSVEGADGLYCSSDIYLYFDSRLKIVGEAIPGAAVSDKLKTVQSVGDTGDFIFLSTAGEADTGKDGEMWHIDFELPANAGKGDKFEVYVGSPKYEGRVPSLFTNFNDNSKGQAMSRYIFSVPARGSIEVIADPAISLGDVDSSGYIDAMDASMILTEYARLSVGDDMFFTGRQFKAADVNGDGVLSAFDASVVLSYYAYASSNGKLSIEEYMKNF